MPATPATSIPAPRSEPNASGSDFRERVRALVADQLGVDLDSVVGEATILEDLGADSLDVVEMVMALEEAFEIEVPDEAIESIKTISDIEAFVAKQTALR